MKVRRGQRSRTRPDLNYSWTMVEPHRLAASGDGPVPVEMHQELDPGRKERCQVCGETILHRYWRVAAGNPRRDMLVWVTGYELVCCFSCMLDARASFDVPLRDRVGLPRPDERSSRGRDEDDVVRGRLALQAKEWWRPAASERPWVTLRTVGATEEVEYDFDAWWHRGNPDHPEIDPPAIEIRGCSPGTPGEDTILFGAVATVAWWLLDGFGPEHAARWVRLGCPRPAWARVELEWVAHTFAPAFPDTRLVDQVGAHPELTSDGEEMVGQLRELGFRSWSRVGAFLSEAARGRSLAGFIDEVGPWIEVATAQGVDRWQVPEQAVWWMATGLDCDDAPRWCRAGITRPFDVKQWVKLNHMGLDEALPWHAAGFGPLDAHSWLHRGLTFDDALNAGMGDDGTPRSAVDVLYERWDARPIRTAPARFRYWWTEGRFYSGVTLSRLAPRWWLDWKMDRRERDRS